MPLIQPTIELIRVPLSDRIFDNTRIKQEAVFSLLEHRQDEATSACTVQVAVTVKSYSDKDGEPGIHLHEKGILDKTIFMGADNDTLVDVATGAILDIRTNENRNDWGGIVAAYEQDTMFQGDYFWMVRKHPVVIEDLIRQHILQADAMGKFA